MCYSWLVIRWALCIYNTQWHYNWPIYDLYNCYLILSPLLQVNGIKGASVFLLFKPFDLVKGFVIDWMHSVCLGVSKSLLNLWLNAENRGKEFFLGSKVQINEHACWKFHNDRIMHTCTRPTSLCNHIIQLP